MGSFVFGAGNGDDIAVTSSPTLGAGATSMFFGWFKPTTLTAGRYYVSVSNTVGLSINATTSELTYITDGATTDGVYNSTGAGIVVNEWVFIAGYVGVVSNPLAGCALWVGRVGQIPLQLTVTQATAMAGTPAGGTSLTMGNRGTGSLALQGNIGWVIWLHSANALAVTGMIPVVTPQTPTQAELDIIYNQHVLPMWRGDWTPEGNGQYAGQTEYSVSRMNLTERTPVLRLERQSATAGTVTSTTATVSGATYSEESPPIPFIPNTPGLRQMVLA